MKKALSSVLLAIVLAIAPGSSDGAPWAYITGGSSIYVLDTEVFAQVAEIKLAGNATGALTTSGSRIYATYIAGGGVSVTSGALAVIDAFTNTIVATIATADNAPWTVAANLQGTRLYVANPSLGTVSVFDTANNSLVGTISGLVQPSRITTNRAGTRVYVTHNTNQLAVVDASSNAVLSNVAVGRNATALAVSSSDTNVYVVNSGDNNVAVVDTTLNLVVSTIPVGTVPNGIVLSPAGTVAFVSNANFGVGDGTITVLDLVSNSVKTTITGATNSPSGIDINADGTLLLVTGRTPGLSLIDPVANKVLGSGSAGVSVTAVGRFIGPNPQLRTTPLTVSFGGQSMGTTSVTQTVTVANTGSIAVGPITVSVTSQQFTQTNNCTSLAASATCTITVAFSPAPTSGALNSTNSVSGYLTLSSPAFGSPNNIALTGMGEKSLVTHYYRAILNRAPEAGGKAFWNAEAARLAGLGANPSETYYVMANYFFNSPEYLAANKTNAQFLTDVYNTFFNRPPDGGGFDYWTSQINTGLSREGVIFWFMFSPEFRTFTQGIFGSTAARAEADMVMDLFRGILNRFPDTAAFTTFVGQLRTAQCQAPAARAGAVYTRVNDLSYFFLFTAPEYAGRARTNTQYVSDMLNRTGISGGSIS